MAAIKPTWEKAYSVVEPQINAEGIHLWPFDPSFPIDIRFFDLDGRHNIRMNRHDYFELLYAYSGEAVYQIHDRRFIVKEGDLAVVGSSQYHRFTGDSSRFAEDSSIQLKAIVLFFLPELVRAAESTGDDMVLFSSFKIPLLGGERRLFALRGGSCRNDPPLHPSIGGEYPIFAG